MASLDLPASSAPPWHQTDTTSAESQLARDVEVCVIGAGIAGLTAAAMLLDRGLSVAVVESHRPGFGTTGRSSAKVTVLHGHHAEQIAKTHDRVAAEIYLRANQWGFDWMAERAGQLTDCQWEVRPAITYATEDDSKAAIEREHRLLASAGIASELDTLELPWGTHPAVLCPDQAQFDPQRFLDGLAEQLVAGGASLHRSTTVTGVHERTGGVLVETSNGTIRAEHVVAATNLPILDRGFHFVRTVPQTSHVVGVKVRNELPLGMYLSAGETLRSIRTAVGPDGDRIVLVGGEGHRTGTVVDTLERQRTLVNWADAHLGVTEVTHRFSAQDYTTPDRVPFAGPIHPGTNRVHVITGLNKWGFTNAPAAAAVVVAHIATSVERPRWAELFSATRIPIAGAGELAKAGVQVARYAIGDWARSLRDDPLHPGQPVGGGPSRDCIASGVCTHLGGIVRWNEAANTWDCPLHGSRFNESGQVMHGPTTKPLRGSDTSQNEGDD